MSRLIGFIAIAAGLVSLLFAALLPGPHPRERTAEVIAVEAGTNAAGFARYAVTLDVIGPEGERFRATTPEPLRLRPLFDAGDRIGVILISRDPPRVDIQLSSPGRLRIQAAVMGLLALIIGGYLLLRYGGRL